MMSFLDAPLYVSRVSLGKRVRTVILGSQVKDPSQCTVPPETA